MEKRKFQKLIHVTIEGSSPDEPYFQVWENGVSGMDLEQAVAIYQLVKVGRVKITKQFKDD